MAAAASLYANGSISAELASSGAVISSIASVAINLPFVLSAGNRSLIARLGVSMLVISALGVAGMLIETRLMALLIAYFPQIGQLQRP